MLTVDKLIKIKEYEELQIKLKNERLNKLIESIDIFKGVENEEEWKQKKEEIKQKKEIEMKKREIHFKNKENKQYISEADDKKNKEIQQKVLEHRHRLQQMYDERMSRRSKN